MCAGFPAFCSLVMVLAGLAQSSPLPGWSSGDPLGHAEEEEPAWEGPGTSDLDSFLENMKEDFLRSLNLSGVPSQEKTSTDPPHFMIELYNRYAADKTSMPGSDIARSFSAEDIMLSSSMNDPIQSHVLLFNVSVPQHEEVTRAELKIHVSLGERHTGHLLIYDILHMEPSENQRDPKSFLESKDIEGSAWETFDVTTAVKRWVKSEKEKNKLEIFLKLNSSLDLYLKSRDIGVTVSGHNPPLLIVFTEDQSNGRKERRKELTEMILHEQESAMKGASKTSALEEEEGTKTSLAEGKTRSKRNAESNYCKKTSLVVNFEDIGWNSWIIAPKRYDAYECKGVCHFPLTDDVTPTKHAIVQALVHLKHPNKTGKPCCVPTKLDAISILYRDDAGVPTLKSHYEGMQVAECGCR
ncbi:hypothetical protein FKM82_029792 [Ascaphus truei]